MTQANVALVASVLALIAITAAIVSATMAAETVRKIRGILTDLDRINVAQDRTHQAITRAMQNLPDDRQPH